MKRLLLLRHAKTARDSGEGDHARVLTDRGRTDAARMGHAMDMCGYLPDSVICSTSQRTTQTWDLLSAELAKSPAAAFRKELYLASPRKILEQIHQTNDMVRSLLVIGHNPGMEECAIRLARCPVSKSESHKLEDMREKYPTCALAVLDFDAVSWSDVTGEGILLEFIRPRDLQD
jgi:phosphohistidine phosphatase